MRRPALHSTPRLPRAVMCGTDRPVSPRRTGGQEPSGRTRGNRRGPGDGIAPVSQSFVWGLGMDPAADSDQDTRGRS